MLDPILEMIFQFVYVKEDAVFFAGQRSPFLKNHGCFGSFRFFNFKTTLKYLCSSSKKSTSYNG